MDQPELDLLQHRLTDDPHLDAYNGAFWDLGFKWQWDAKTFCGLLSMPDERERIRSYVKHCQPHLLKAYDLEFLADLIHANKTLRYDALVAARSTGQPHNLTCNAINGKD